MAFGYASFPAFAPRTRDEYACVGVPPEKKVAPEPHRNGAVLAGLGRVLREAFGASPGPDPRGPQRGLRRGLRRTW